MEINALFSACRKGDLQRVQYLVENCDVELNVRDKWDSTPLYYACLCGHEELVKYLLENDAKCEANTFDGERCLYGALSNHIRNLLRNYKAVTSSTIRRDLYTEFLRKLLDRSEDSEDVVFNVEGDRFIAHRCVLAARSEYFAQRFRTTWKNKRLISVNKRKVTASAFRLMLQYLYTARIEVQVEQVTELISLARSCQLITLESSLEERLRSVKSFECTKPGVSVTVVSLEPALTDRSLQRALGILADEAVPIEYMDQAGRELPFLPERTDWFHDIIFSVDGYKFRCHKVFLAGRSDYFKIIMKDSFQETQHRGSPNTADEDDDGLQVVVLRDICASIFLEILYYIYQDSCRLTEQNVYEIMCKADEYLLPGLKRLCAGKIAQYLDIQNVINILRSARLFNISRLENQCISFICSHLEEMLQSDEFIALVIEDASTVEKRQETDSIPIIDDLRFHITNHVQSYSDMYEADQRLSAIDSFLEQLQLDA